MIVSKSNVELDLMREAGQIVAVQGALPSRDTLGIRLPSGLDGC